MAESEQNQGKTENGQPQEPEPTPGEPFAREMAHIVVSKCRGHYHVGSALSEIASSAVDARAAALEDWSGWMCYDDTELLERLAVAEEDRFNESGTYRPTGTPDALRRIARDLVRFRALAAVVPPERDPVLAVDRSRSTPDEAVTNG